MTVARLPNDTGGNNYTRHGFLVLWGTRACSIIAGMTKGAVFFRQLRRKAAANLATCKVFNEGWRKKSVPPGVSPIIEHALKAEDGSIEAAGAALVTIREETQRLGRMIDSMAYALWLTAP